MDAVADTHAVIWYLADDKRLGEAARERFERCGKGEGVIFIPTICLVEIAYLEGRGRISTPLLAKLLKMLAGSVTGWRPSA